jgi:hypothetical protein
MRLLRYEITRLYSLAVIPAKHPKKHPVQPTGIVVTFYDQRQSPFIGAA